MTDANALEDEDDRVTRDSDWIVIAGCQCVVHVCCLDEMGGDSRKKRP